MIMPLYSVANARTVDVSAGRFLYSPGGSLGSGGGASSSGAGITGAGASTERPSSPGAGAISGAGAGSIAWARMSVGPANRAAAARLMRSRRDIWASLSHAGVPALALSGANVVAVPAVNPREALRFRAIQRELDLPPAGG